MSRKHPAAKCEECPLYDEGRFAGGTGPSDSKLAVVGEAPGFTETQTGKPFTGPSGRLLDTVLEHHGLDRSEFFITNVVACRPPSNRPPTKVEIKCCHPRLVAELKARPVEKILALGNTASQALLDTRAGITTVRSGPAKRGPVLPEVDVVATIHPAYVLRVADAFPTLVNDIGKLTGGIDVTWQEPDYAVFDDVPQALQVLKELKQFDTIVVDIECGIEKDTGFDHPDHFSMLSVGLGYAKGKVVVIGEEACKSDAVRDSIFHLLDGCRVVAHNGKFDLAGLQPFFGGRRPALHFDTMLASYVLDERTGGHGLKYLATELLGTPQYDDEVKKYVGKGDSYALIPRPILYKYNAFDVAATWQLMELFSQEMAKEEGLTELHDFLVDAANGLIDAEMQGLSVDLEYLDAQTETYLASLEELEKKLRPWVENPRSPQQVKAALNEMGIKVVESTDVEHLESFRSKYKNDDNIRAFIDLMLEQRREQKLYGTYIKGTRKRLYKGRVHPTFLLHGTTTGRLACRNPNLQNVPRESSIRRLFVPAEGNVFVQADYSQAELRVVAALAQDEYLQGVLNDPGRDIHGEVAERFFGPGWTKEQRVRAKAVVFGLTYGREAYSLAQEYGWSMAEATKYMEDFFGIIPGVVAWREEIKQSILKSQDDLVSPFGRRRRFWLITDDNRKDVVKEGLAFLPQSTASDICLAAATKLRREVGLSVRLLVHDSIMVECPADDSDQVAEVMSKVMEQSAVDNFTDYVKFRVDINVGQSWGEL